MEEPCETSALNFLQPKVVGVHYTFGSERGLGNESYAHLVSGHHPLGPPLQGGTAGGGARGWSGDDRANGGADTFGRMGRIIAHLLSGHHPAPRLRRKSDWGWAADDGRHGG